MVASKILNLSVLVLNLVWVCFMSHQIKRKSVGGSQCYVIMWFPNWLTIHLRLCSNRPNLHPRTDREGAPSSVKNDQPVLKIVQKPAAYDLGPSAPRGNYDKKSEDSFTVRQDLQENWCRSHKRSEVHRESDKAIGQWKEIRFYDNMLKGRYSLGKGKGSKWRKF